MYRSLIVAVAILVPVAARAQYAQPSPYPTDGAYDDPRAGSNPWQQVAPYAREDQTDDGRPDDAAHQADRAYTATLNRRTWPGRNAEPPRQPAGTSSYSAELADHDRDMLAYREAQARYAAQMQEWRARSDACERGYIEACQAPQ